jgi:hypothetical protein
MLRNKEWGAISRDVQNSPLSSLELLDALRVRLQQYYWTYVGHKIATVTIHIHAVRVCTRVLAPAWPHMVHYPTPHE